MYKIHYPKHDIYRIYVKTKEAMIDSIQTEATHKADIILQNIIIVVIVVVVVIVIIIVIII